MFSLSLALVAATAPVDAVIVNARIWSDGRPGFAEFAAIQGGRFTYVGSPKPELRRAAKTIIDAAGATVIPGIIDSHIHLMGGGESLSTLNLRPARSRNEFVDMVRSWASALPADQWIIGFGWSVESWPDKAPPTRHWVDRFSGGRPLLLERMDGHSALANSEALRRAGIDRNGPPDPPGGVIDRDADGEPTGILRETAVGLVSRLIPPKTKSQILKDLERAATHLNSLGITAVCDIPGADLSAYEELAKRSNPTLRIFLYPTVSNWTQTIPTLKAKRFREGWVELKGLKAYMDGSLGSRTAYMREPFSNNEPERKDWRGLPMPGAMNGDYAKFFKAASTNGLQAIVHAIGDEGNHLLLDLLRDNYTNLASGRCRSEHAQHLLPTDIPRFAQLGVIASMQPYHKADDGRYAEGHIGAERCHTSYAFKMLLDAGVVLAFGSDWPVVDANPFLGIEAAVTGRIMTGSIWEPQNNITVAEALRAYTSSAAYAAFEEREIGRIEPGYRADFVILEGSPFGRRNSWATIRPRATYVEGRRVYFRPR